MPSIRHRFHRVVPAASLSVAFAVATGPSAHAADVELFVQAPYELDPSLLVRFDLDRLHAHNDDPLFADRFEIPYDVVEPAIAEELAKAVDGVRRFHVDCPTIFCPDTDIDVTIRSTFAFTQHHQPSVTTVGPASGNTVRVALDTQASVGLDVRIETDTGVWLSSKIPLGLHALVGIHAEATLTLWPTLSASGVEVSLTHDGGNLAFGETSGMGAAGPEVSKALVDLAVDIAKPQIEAEIDAAVAKELAAASTRLTALAQAVVTPKLAEANAVRDELMTTPIPTVGRSLEQLVDEAGITLDVRTRAAGNRVTTVVTTRFQPEPAGRQLHGTIRLPKTTCVYGPPVGNDTVGYSRLPEKVETVNADLAGKACATVITAAGLRRVAYLGESPDKHLQSGNPANVLPNWAATGTVSAPGVVVDAGSHYECAYTIGNLADASFLELGVEPGSALAKRMPMQEHDPKLRARFLHATLGGVVLLLDAQGKPVGPAATTFGRANPTTVEQCPLIKSDGKGRTLPKGFDVARGLDPDTCITCGVLDLRRHTNARVRPGDVARFDHGVVMNEVLGPARARTEAALAKTTQVRVKQAGLSSPRAKGRLGKAPAKLPQTHIHVRSDATRR